MARAIRRCGELLKQVEPKQGANQNIHDATDTKVLTRTEAAKEAGLSERQARELYERRLREYLARNC